MMDFEDFKTIVFNYFKGLDTEHAFELKDVKKLQKRYTGLAVSETKRAGEAAVVADLNAEYDLYLESGDLMKVLSDIEKTYVEGLSRAGEISEKSAKAIGDYSEAKKRLVTELVPVAGNEEVLATAPHDTYGDMARVFKIMVSDEGDENRATVLVTYPLMERLNVTKKTLSEDASEYAPVNRPARFVGMSEMLAELMGVETPECGDEMFYVATCEDGSFGAAVITYPHYLEDVCEYLDSSVYIIPSSVHECLIIPDDSTDPDALREMIREVNNSTVAPEDRLSYEPYHYDRTENLLEPADSYMHCFTVR